MSDKWVHISFSCECNQNNVKSLNKRRNPFFSQFLHSTAGRYPGAVLIGTAACDEKKSQGYALQSKKTGRERAEVALQESLLFIPSSTTVDVTLHSRNQS